MSSPSAHYCRALPPSRAPGLIATLPFAAVIAFTLALLSHRSSPVEASVLLLQLVPLLVVPVLPLARLSDGLACRFVMVAVAYQAWMAINLIFNPAALLCGWWRFAEHAMAFVLLLALVVLRPEPRQWLRTLGSSLALAAAVAVSFNAYIGTIAPGDTSCFGFGHVNILMNTATGTLIAWGLMIIIDRRAGVRVAWIEVAVLLAGVAALIVQGVGVRRRGALVAVAAIMAVFAWRWCWRKNRAFAVALAIAALIGASLVAVQMFSQSIPTARNERVKIYRAALDGIAESYPWGFGHFGQLHIQHASGEAARHLTATGGYGVHAHQELLDQLLDGGVIAGVLCVLMMALVAYHTWHLRDPAIRAAGLALGTATVVHAMTDNIYGTIVGQAWAGMVAGFLLAQPADHPVPRAVRWLPPIRLIAWPFVLVSAWGASRILYPTLIHTDASVAVQIRCLDQAMDPQTIAFQSVRVIGNADDAVSIPTRRAALRRGAGKMGWFGYTAAFDAYYSQLDGTMSEQVEAHLRVLHFSPFHRQGYEYLGSLLKRHRHAEGLVPSRVRMRLAYLEGVPTLPPPDLSTAPTDIEEAADLFAFTTWAIVMDRPWHELVAPLKRLVEGYGDIPGVIGLVIMAAGTAPPGTFDWLVAHAPAMEIGMGYTDLILPHLQELRTPAQAAGVFPLVKVYYRQVVEECEQGTLVMPQRYSAAYLAWRVAVTRLWGLQRRWRPVPLAPAEPAGITPAPSP